MWVTTGGEHQSVHHQQDSNAYLMRPLRLVVEKLTSQINGLLPRGYSAGRATVLQRPRTTPRRQTLSQTESGALRSVPACLPACLPAQIYFKVTPSNEILLLWCSSLTVIASKLPGALEPRADSPTADRKAAELEQIRRLPLTLEQVAAYSVARG